MLWMAEQTEQDFREIERERDLPPDDTGGSSDDLPLPESALTRSPDDET